MKFEETILKGAYIVHLEPVTDPRGWFARTFCKEDFLKIGHKKEWLQLNHSVTNKKGTIRGMHYQLAPHCEIKMVRCIAGSIYDVIVDLRKNSPTFLNWFGTELSAANKKMLYIPEGFAHGFQTLEDNCELIYHHTATYTPSAEAGIKFSEEKIEIKWPLTVTEISERDLSHQNLSNSFNGIEL